MAGWRSDRAWTVARIQARLVSGTGQRVSSGDGGPAAGPDAVPGSMVAVAVTRAAATAMRVICRPGHAADRDPRAGESAKWQGPGPYALPGSGIVMIAADAAGTVAQASRAPVTAVRAAIVRRRRGTACGCVRLRVEMTFPHSIASCVDVAA